MKQSMFKGLNSGFKNKMFLYRAIFILAILEFIITFCLYGGPIYTPDSQSYINATKVLIGIPDIGRTPVYPATIGIMHYIFGSYRDVAVVILQFSIFMISAKYLYKLGNQFIRNNKIVFSIVAIYILYPGIQNFTLYILTETFAVSGMIFFCWSLVRNIDRKITIADIIIQNLWLTMLIFLRPIFVCLIPIVFIYYSVILWKNNIPIKYKLVAFLSPIIVICLLLGYKNIITNRYGIKSISSVTTINNYFSIRYMCMTEPQLANDANLRQCLEGFKNKDIYRSDIVWDEIKEINQSVDISKFEEYVNAVIHKHPLKYIYGLMMRWSQECSQYKAVADTRWFPGYNIENIFIPNMAFYWLILCICIGILFKYGNKHRKIPKLFTLYTLICTCVFITTVLGAQAEYSRLNLPAFPMFLLLIGNIASMYKRNSKLLI